MSFPAVPTCAPLVALMLRLLDGVVCQVRRHRGAVPALGVERVEVVGSVKFDAAPPADDFGLYDLGYTHGAACLAG